MVGAKSPGAGALSMEVLSRFNSDQFFYRGMGDVYAKAGRWVFGGRVLLWQEVA